MAECAFSPSGSVAVRRALLTWEGIISAPADSCRTYGVVVTIDPTPFLATVVGTSATLAAIVGGLLVARFVTIDSDQRTSRKVLADARERLDAARDRASAAWRAVLDWDADDFFWSSRVTKAIGSGVTETLDLVRAEDWEHGEEALKPYAEQAAAEYRPRATCCRPS